MSNEHSFLYPDSAQLVFGKISDLTINVQQFILPSQAIGSTDVNFGGGKTAELPGTSYIIEPLKIGWIAREDLKIYWAIHDWKRRLTDPHSVLGSQEYTDASILLFNNSGEQIETINFANLFPVSLSEVSFDLTDADPSPIKLNASFAFESMDRSRFYNEKT
ncbi:MAG: hypothetical protein QM489_00910 [Candidatus Izemoplasma sp.]